MESPQGLSLAPDHVCIGVTDLDGAIRWYSDVLGFEVDTQWTVPELPGFRLAYIKKGDWRIELIDSGERVPQPVKPMAERVGLLTDRLGELRTPTPVVHGQHDGVVPLAQSERVASQLASARLELFHHSGHWPQLEEPDRFVRVVREFIDGEEAP